MPTPTAPMPTAGDLRAALARADVELYRIAPAVGLHPNHLGAYLAGRRPLTPEIAARVLAAIAAASNGE